MKPRHETHARPRAVGHDARGDRQQVKGVTEGFEKNLELTGVGYRAAMQGKNLQMQLGYSHAIIYTPPEGITIAVPKPTEIKISGIDPQPSAKPPRKSARTVRPSPTRARACAMRANTSAARKARRSSHGPEAQSHRAPRAAHPHAA